MLQHHELVSGACLVVKRLKRKYLSVYFIILLLRSALEPSIICRISQIQKVFPVHDKVWFRRTSETLFMAVLTVSVSNGARRYFPSAMAGMGLTYMWWLWFLSALPWCLALLMCWNLEEGETYPLMCFWYGCSHMERASAVPGMPDTCLGVPDVVQTWFLEGLGSTEGWQVDVEVGPPGVWEGI